MAAPTTHPAPALRRDTPTRLAVPAAPRRRWLGSIVVATAVTGVIAATSLPLFT